MTDVRLRRAETRLATPRENYRSDNYPGHKMLEAIDHAEAKVEELHRLAQRTIAALNTLATIRPSTRRPRTCSLLLTSRFTRRRRRRKTERRAVRRPKG